MPRNQRWTQRIIRAWHEDPRTWPMKVWTTFYRRMIVTARPLDEPLPEYQPPIPVDFRLLTENDVPAYLACCPHHDAHLVNSRLNRHHRCFAVWHDHRIVNVAWLATDRVDITYLRITLNLAPEEALLYNSFTLAAFRRRGLARARDAHVLQHFQREGFRRILSFIAVENKAGWRSMRAGGYRPIGMFRCLLFGHWQRIWLRADPDADIPVAIKTLPPNEEGS